jgi:hypothetical protein
MQLLQRRFPFSLSLLYFSFIATILSTVDTTGTLTEKKEILNHIMKPQHEENKTRLREYNTNMQMPNSQIASNLISPARCNGTIEETKSEFLEVVKYINYKQH